MIKILTFLTVAIACLFFTSCLSQQAWELSVETNVVMMEKYYELSQTYTTMLKDFISQMKAQGRNPEEESVFPEWLKEHDLQLYDVIRMAEAFNKMAKSGVMDNSPMLQSALDITDDLLKLRKVYYE